MSKKKTHCVTCGKPLEEHQTRECVSCETRDREEREEQYAKERDQEFLRWLRARYEVEGEWP